MGDRYLQEHHAYAIAQKAHPGGSLRNRVPDEKSSWVMLTQRGGVVELPHETILHKPSSRRISIELSVPDALRISSPFSAKSSDGEVYITNQRVIYLPERPTETFKSFAAPILNFEDSRIPPPPWFGPWFWVATVQPVSGGGIPPEIPRIQVKLSFKDGGHTEFREKFERIKERLHHARELERELGRRITVPDEELPAYQPRDPAPSAARPGDGARTASEPVGGRADDGIDREPDTAEVGQGRPGQETGPETTGSRPPPPNEPPPGYDEAQAQQVTMRLEDHIREEADRN